MGESVSGLSGICAVEGYNGCNLHAFNTRAIETAEALHLPFTGGSDAHAPEEVGSCYTVFYDAVTHDNFIGALKAGNYRGIDTRKISQALIA
jgi:predicted metal-dependent phosphoesterase TrpH